MTRNQTIPSGNPDLIAFIVDTIRASGPIPFRWFMEQALYHPQFGYYAAGTARIGRRGDFFTNVSVGPLFGKILAGVFADMWERLGKPHPFTIVEQGAHDGDFANDVLTTMARDFASLADAADYCIVEPFEVLEPRQRTKLAAFADKTRWARSISELQPFCGVHFSNELLDAMPVHLVRFRNGEWREKFVDAQDDHFIWIDKAPTNNLREPLDAAGAPRIENYETEINLEVLEWIDALAQKIERGFVLAFDYGCARHEFFAPERTRGTISGYLRHERQPDPLENAGLADITAHVEFTSLAERAVQAGFILAAFTDQHHFMVGAARDLLSTNQASPPNEIRAFKTLMHPEMLGTTFKVLALAKNVMPELSAFRFARGAATALSLK
ncbi:MAG: SAM-dependent methyltransferase [Verrucomicrobiota bacterium]|nr:SAM-dependent methyltransferase [Verrucomicrobiota bacterium]